MNQLEDAIEYARVMHHGQKYGQQPYTFHLNEVQRFAIYFNLTVRMPGILTAVWLHDIIEDTDATVFDIKNRFGDEMAKWVFAVTDGEGKNRAERKAKAYIKIQNYGTKAVALKLADRIANVNFSKATNPRLFKMYSKEHESFYNALYSEEDNLQEMWDYLDSLLNE